jgi:hypothetical protein
VSAHTVGLVAGWRGCLTAVEGEPCLWLVVLLALGEGSEDAAEVELDEVCVGNAAQGIELAGSRVELDPLLGVLETAERIVAEEVGVSRVRVVDAPERRHESRDRVAQALVDVKRSIRLHRPSRRSFLVRFFLRLSRALSSSLWLMILEAPMPILHALSRCSHASFP